MISRTGAKRHAGRIGHIGTFGVGAGLLLLLLAAPSFAQDQHVAWTLTAEPAAAAPRGKILVRMAGKIQPGWHLYSMSTPGAMPTKITVTGPVDKTRALQPAPRKSFDPNFNAETEYFEDEVAFLVEAELKPDLKPGPVELAVAARYQTCDAKSCVPSKWSGTATVRIDPASAAAAPAIPAGYTEPAAPPPPGAAPSPSPAPQQDSLAGFLAVAFGFGLASIFTPCVFPMIPITMSYFLNRQSGSRRESIMQALVFCVGIVVLFSGMGLAITAALGPFGIVQLGSNPWVNGFITALFIAFGLSLLGAFEITIPSSILTRLNQSADRGGYAGSLLMGLTFSLASFACVGPFVGTLLAASVSGGGSRPLIGMVTFATGLALPFFLLALFPSYLKRMPRAGGWMSRIKVVMGFVILAASLKYFSSLDQVMQWGFLTRERFLAAWVVLFALAGLYLLGMLRMEGIKPEEPVGIGRLLSGAALLIFAIHLIPGMSGARLGDLDAFVPAAAEEAAGGGGAAAASGSLVWMKNQYREALDRARREGKLVFVNFTGYACTNCHWMRANMFTKPEIASALQGFVLVELYTDGTDAASELNQKVELDKFKTVAIPFYAILDPDEKVIATFPGKTSDAKEFLAFLNTPAPAAAAQAAAPATPPPPAPAPAIPATASAPPAGIPAFTPLSGAAPDLKGKVVVVNFWATWCVPCVREIPGFNKLHQDYAPKGVAVLGIGMDDEGAERIKPFLVKHPIAYPVGVGSAEMTDKYKLDALPVTLVFDRTGKQIKRFEGFTPEDELLAAIRGAL
ncbi:MAG: redoxin family protein [Acidobacteria bacterium]|nr:redoxin family protein [Acidobacteriota bacterium]